VSARGTQTRMARPSRLSHWKYGIAIAMAGSYYIRGLTSGVVKG
jgi:hypothetical protein